MQNAQILTEVEASLAEEMIKKQLLNPNHNFCYIKNLKQAVKNFGVNGAYESEKFQNDIDKINKKHKAAGITFREIISYLFD